MDVSGSESSSGCESGWTMYLDESCVFPRDNSNKVSLHQSYRRIDSVISEEDLSMVSDASSGPPANFQEVEVDEDGCYSQNRHYHHYPEKSSKREKRPNKERRQVSKQYQHLDDTATSPAISYAKMYENQSANQASFMGFPQNFSETHFQGNTAMSNHYGYWQSSHPNTADSAEPSKMRGRRRG